MIWFWNVREISWWMCTICRRITQRVSYKKQEVIALLEHLSLPPYFWCGLCCSSFYFFLIFLCCPIMCLYVLDSVLWCPLRFPHKNDVWLVFTSSCLREGACLIYVISVCLVRLYLQLFVEGLMSYLCYLCLFGSSLPPVVCRKVHVLFMLLVFVWFVFTSSCL